MVEGIKGVDDSQSYCKARFELRVMEEKAAEAKKVFQNNFDNTDVFIKAANNYAEAKNRLKARLESLKDNPNIQDLLEKAEDQIEKHDKLLLNDLTIKVLRNKVEKGEDQKVLEIELNNLENETENQAEVNDDCGNAPLPDRPAPPQGCNYEANVCVKNAWIAGKMVCEQPPGEITE